MPFVNVKTNVDVKEKCEEIKSELGQAITAIPGKSENWLMVGIEDNYKLYFRGTDEPAAMVEVNIFGKADSAAFEKLTGKITEILSGNLGISPDRIYVSFNATPDWGWNGSNL